MSDQNYHCAKREDLSRTRKVKPGEFAKHGAGRGMPKQGDRKPISDQQTRNLPAQSKDNECS